jgi:predicted CXXCH cytochrome family protein
MLPEQGAAFCLSCHDDPRTGKKALHPPVAQGECTACHNPHAGKAKGMLPAAGAALCDECHDSKT